jgi:hypothetical protein
MKMSLGTLAAWAFAGVVAASPAVARAQAGACCRPDGTCFQVAASGDCFNTTVKGAFISGGTCTPGLCVPDVIVGDLQDAWRWGQVDINTTQTQIYSFGTYSCNIGTSNLIWQQNTNLHPVISQDMFRLKNGRIEHIGMAWLKHGFFALSNNICGGGCPFPTNGTTLGVGCADPYSAQGENGTQSRLGPRNIVNPTTGVFPYTTSQWPPFSGTAPRRLQVPTSDISDTTALYFIQGQYFTQDDAQAGRGLNNASYRRVSFNGTTPTMRNTTERTKPAIYAWRDFGGGLTGGGAPIADTSVIINFADVQGDGRFYAGSKVIDLGGGQYRYEYAVQNLNSDRCASGLSIPLPRWATVSATNFRSLPYRDGDGYLSVFGGPVRNFDPGAWTPAQNTASKTYGFSLVPAAPVENSNAIRFATLFNFSITTNVPPTTGSVTLNLFKAPTAGSPATTVSIDNLQVPAICPCDWDGGGLAPADIFGFLNAYFAADPATDFDNNGIRQPADIFAFLNCYFARPSPCAAP